MKLSHVPREAKYADPRTWQESRTAGSSENGPRVEEDVRALR